MSPLTLEVPDELAERLRPLQEDLPHILELGLSQLEPQSPGSYRSGAEVFELLARLPSPEEILALRPSAKTQARLRALLTKIKGDGLTPTEEREWRQYEYVEHLVRMAKATARLRLDGR
jgi:hypothetical protein